MKLLFCGFSVLRLLLASAAVASSAGGAPAAGEYSNSENFTFEEGEASFPLAPSPTADELRGVWTLAGLAEFTGTVGSAYFSLALEVVVPGADVSGRFATPALPGFFRTELIFGDLALRKTRVGNESGKVYATATYPLDIKTKAEGGVSFIESAADGGTARVECRLNARDNGQETALLCAVTPITRAAADRSDYRGAIMLYEAYVVGR